MKTLVINNSIFKDYYDNTSNIQAAFIYIMDSNCNLDSNTFEGGRSNYGAIYSNSIAYSFVIKNCNFLNNM